MVTIADVARRAGVSIATVSRVLSPGATPHPVSPATAERVRQAALELRFVPSEVARGLVARRSGLLGLLVPDLNDPHYPQIASGVELSARHNDLAVLIGNTLGDVDNLSSYLDFFHARRADAIVLSGGSSLGAAELALVRELDAPVVLIGRPLDTDGIVYVGIDNVGAAVEATRHLMHLDRKNIVHLAGPVGQLTMRDRIAGFRRALEGLGGEPEVIPTTTGSAEDGYAQTAEYLRCRGTRACDAIFAATDRLAIGAMAAVHDAKQQVPRDVAIIGIDDLPVGQFLRPSLSSMAQPAEQLGTIAVELAMRALSGEQVASRELRAELRARDSTQACV